MEESIIIMAKKIAKIMYYIALPVVITFTMLYLDVLCLFSFYLPVISSDISEMNIVLYLFSTIFVIFIIITVNYKRHTIPILMLVCLSIQLLLRIGITKSIELLEIKTDRFCDLCHIVDYFRLIGLISLIIYAMTTGYRIKRLFVGIDLIIIVLMIAILQASMYIDSRYYICLLTMFILMAGVIFQKKYDIRDKQYYRKQYLFYFAIAIVIGNALLISIDVNNRKEISNSVLIKHQAYISLLSNDNYWNEDRIELFNSKESILYENSHDEDEYIHMIRQLLVKSQKKTTAKEYWYVNGKYYGLQYSYSKNNCVNVGDVIIQSSSFILPHPKHSFDDNSDIVDELNDDIWIIVTYTSDAETCIDYIRILKS